MDHKSGLLVVGHYGGHNTGDEAMLAGLVTALPTAWREGVTIVARGGDEGCSMSGFEGKYIQPSLGPFLRALGASRAVILGGGTHFHDEFNGWRALRHFRYMARYSVLSIAAKLLGRKVMWLGMGFGPLVTWLTKFIAALGLRACDVVTVRDQQSLREVNGYVRPSRLVLAFDLAALLLKNVPVATKAAPPILGISLTIQTSRRLRDEAPALTCIARLGHALEQILRSRPELRVRIFVIRGGKREDDRQVSETFYHRLQECAPDRVSLVPYSDDPTETLRRIGECRAFIATRFHAAIFAYLTQCDLMLIPYHRKLNDLAAEIGLSEDALLPLSDSVSEQLMVERISALLDGHSRFKPSLPVSEAVRRADLNIDNLLAQIGQCEDKLLAAGAGAR